MGQALGKALGALRQASMGVVEAQAAQVPMEAGG